MRPTRSLSAIALALALGAGCPAPDDFHVKGGEGGVADAADAAPATDADASGGEVATDAADGTGHPADHSWYTMRITTAAGTVYDLDEDITELTDVYSFGSTHIAPAVSFAMEQHFVMPNYMVVTLNFGIVVGSIDKPLQCGAAGEYPFGGLPPEVKVSVEGLPFESSVAGSAGAVTVETWTTFPGELFSGTFAGRIYQVTTKTDKLWLDVEGRFHFLVPEPQ